MEFLRTTSRSGQRLSSIFPMRDKHIGPKSGSAPTLETQNRKWTRRRGFVSVLFRIHRTLQRSYSI